MLMTALWLQLLTNLLNGLRREFQNRWKLQIYEEERDAVIRDVTIETIRKITEVWNDSI